MTLQPLSSTRPARRRRTSAVAGAAAAIVALAIAVALGFAGSGGSGSDAVADGTASAGGLTVEGAVRHLGQVPLDVTVEPTWTIRNTSDETVTLGTPHAEVLEGCCPGPLQLGTRALGPREETTLVFPLQMHEGMDGQHDFDVHLPVLGPTAALLTLGVDGNFGS